MSLRFAILGFLDIEPTTGYTLGQRFSGSVGSFWTATRSQIYRELHQLARDRQVTVRVLPQAGKPARKEYTITPAGKAALTAWLHEPVGPPVMRDPFMLKFVFAGETSSEAVDQLLEGYADEISGRRTEYEARLSMAGIFSLARSEREALLWRLSLENGLAWCKGQLEWAIHARARLGSGRAGGANGPPPP